MRGKSQSTPYDLVIVGGGPRAVSTLERLDAWLQAAADHGADGLIDSRPVTVAVIDAVEIGAGATWRTDQTAQFLNNTTSNATTIYPDASTVLVGPLREGPTFVDWASGVALCASHPTEWVVAEARDVTPGSFPTRRLQGVYYAEQLERFAASGRLDLTRVRGLAVDVRGGAGDAGRTLGRSATRTVVLDDGRMFEARTVILAQGMVQAVPDSAIAKASSFAARHGVTYIDPGMPAEKPWHEVPTSTAPSRSDVSGTGEVIVQGLGANFFDVVSELTAGRGGSFEPVEGDAYGRLRYVPSGAEPRLVAVSRRGVPYRSKGDFGDEKPEPFDVTFATRAWFDELGARDLGSVDFATEVWPVVAADLAFGWARALHARHPERFSVPLDEVRMRLGEAIRREQGVVPDRVGSAGRVGAAHRAGSPGKSWRAAVPHIDRVMLDVITEIEPFDVFTIDSLRRPTRGDTVTRAEWRSIVTATVEAELDALANPRESPRQAVNRAMGALRGPVSRLAVRGVFTAESTVLDVHGWFNADGLFLASGPPAPRVREVLALIEAGVVRLLGPDSRVVLDDATGRFTAHSAVTGETVTSTTFIETRMSKGKVPNTSDPLLRALLARGDARVHTLADASGVFETESLEALPREHPEFSLSLVNAEGVADARVLVLGIPAQSTQPGSAIGATPGLSSPLLAGADVAASRVLANR